jgi:hypothetical protein
MAGDLKDMHNSMELWQTLPSQLFTWWASYDSDLAITTCTRGSGNGQPTAHIPVAQITAAAIETSYINSYYGPTPTSTLPAGPTSTSSPPTSSPATEPPDSSSYTPPPNNGLTSSNPSLNYLVTPDWEIQGPETKKRELLHRFPLRLR